MSQKPPSTPNQAAHAERPLPALSKDGSIHVTDEHINTCTHLGAAVFALLGGAWLIVQSATIPAPWYVVGFAVYAFTLFTLFFSSTLHHGINGSQRTEHVLRVIDYSAVFLLIAGTYTPICLGPLRGPLGWVVLGVNWLIAGVGIALRASYPTRPTRITNTLYITAGWTAIAIIWPLYTKLGLGAILTLGLAGLIYSAGLVVFALERPNPIPGRFCFHEVWHLMVVAATGCNYAFMLFYVLPMASNA